jgi:hypothetical protein
MGPSVSGYKRGDWVVVTLSERDARREGCAVRYRAQSHTGHWVTAPSHGHTWKVEQVRPATPDEIQAAQLDQLAGGGL